MWRGHPSSISIEKIDVSNAQYAVRQYNPNSLVIKSGFAFGSCPYIFTYSEKTDTWLNEGHILYIIIGKEREKYDEIQLINYNSNGILIKELESETSFIDCLYLKVIDSPGQQKIFSANNKLLKKDDGEYIILDKGDEIKVNFENLPAQLRNENVYIVAKSYYVPYKTKTTILRR